MIRPFIPNKIYNRRQHIHAKYGGSWQGGITPSRAYPFIFIFSGINSYGYIDRWDNENVFSYTGEGQIGDMKFVRGNLALQRSLINDKRVFLFDFVKKGFVKFICELEFLESDYIITPDKQGKKRQAIRFFFKRKGVDLGIELSALNPNTILEPTLPYHVNFPNVTERQGLITSRVGQGAYRKSILHRWHYKCAVTGFDKTQVLIASHILPWKDATDIERFDVNNGILLSPTFDALFDRSLISFDKKGKILLSDKIKPQTFQLIGVTGKERIKDLSTENTIYLQKHQDDFSKLNR